jgi:hypothetical protein
MRMDDELPVVDWLLRDRVAEIFQTLAPNHRDELQQFVLWFLDRARRYTPYFTGEYEYTSFVVYAYGRPRFALWARLAREVEEAAMNLGIPIPRRSGCLRCLRRTHKSVLVMSEASASSAPETDCGATPWSRFERRDQGS